MDEQDTESDLRRSADLTVSELTAVVKGLLEENLPVVSVIGELSNYVRHSSGHHYFTLKDDRSQLRCVMFKWQGDKLDFKPEEGMLVRAVGNVTVYERSGQYQLTVLRLTPRGRGDLLAQLEALKQRLAAEGLFARKRSLPSFPSCVGVITSPTGAAVRDIISIIRRRAPYMNIILRPTVVQGAAGADDIVAAFDDLNSQGEAEVIIAGRGGGSIEDLWCFNEERVARAFAGSPIPVVSAVGHETDVTLADFAADLRAPTPSAAAELVVPSIDEIRRAIAGQRESLCRSLEAIAERLTQRVELVGRGMSPERFLQRLAFQGQTVDELGMRIEHRITRLIDDQEATLHRIGRTLEALNPRGVLSRGYAIVRRSPDNVIVTDAERVSVNDAITIELARGGVSAYVTETRF